MNISRFTNSTHPALTARYTGLISIGRIWFPAQRWAGLIAHGARRVCAQSAAGSRTERGGYAHGARGSTPGREGTTVRWGAPHGLPRTFARGASREGQETARGGRSPKARRTEAPEIPKRGSEFSLEEPPPQGGSCGMTFTGSPWEDASPRAAGGSRGKAMTTPNNSDDESDD